MFAHPLLQQIASDFGHPQRPEAAQGPLGVRKGYLYPTETAAMIALEAPRRRRLFRRRRHSDA